MAETREILSVSALNRAVKTLLETRFGSVWVEGEVSNLSRPRSGHVYFSLKDDAASVRCAMFRSRARQVGFELEEGQQLLVAGRVGMYEARGDYQLIVEHAEPAGEGLLRIQFDRLKRKLAGEGLFDPATKITPPLLPRRIGVVTSPTGAALRDILQVLARRNPALSVIVYPTAVQGTQAAPGIVAALGVAERRAECDVLILARGGGSLEDLWPFNEESVARAVAACTIPIVCGVGHEVDVTIADFVADVRAPTPSAAAELCAPHRDELMAQVTNLARRARGTIDARLREGQTRLHHLRKRLMHPGRRLEQLQQRLDELSQRLPQALRTVLTVKRGRATAAAARLRGARPERLVNAAAERLRGSERRLADAMTRRLERDRSRLDALGRTLAAVSPHATQQRGYAIVSTAAGVIVRDATTLTPGDPIVAALAHGTVSATVSAVDDTPPLTPGDDDQR